MLPNTLAVLLHAVPAERKGATIAIWASMSGIGVVGDVGGGALLSAGSWRWLFVALAVRRRRAGRADPRRGWPCSSSARWSCCSRCCPGGRRAPENRIHSVAQPARLSAGGPLSTAGACRGCGSPRCA
ncbi:hypothetical protein [Nonomuraea phyllanthi]|uniref:hypothetical protein n=1 Tax=Nonomuraea phyllanthi TaxID=2219224 RepID=UPI001D15B70D